VKETTEKRRRPKCFGDFDEHEECDTCPWRLLCEQRKNEKTFIEYLLILEDPKGIKIDGEVPIRVNRPLEPLFDSLLKMIEHFTKNEGYVIIGMEKTGEVEKDDKNART
jgi:hypothetical protein